VCLILCCLIGIVFYFVDSEVVESKPVVLF
jgi:hypothetical protein